MPPVWQLVLLQTEVRSCQPYHQQAVAISSHFHFSVHRQPGTYPGRDFIFKLVHITEYIQVNHGVNVAERQRVQKSFPSS